MSAPLSRSVTRKRQRERITNPLPLSRPSWKKCRFPPYIFFLNPSPVAYLNLDIAQDFRTSPIISCFGFVQIRSRFFLDPKNHILLANPDIRINPAENGRNTAIPGPWNSLLNRIQKWSNEKMVPEISFHRELSLFLYVFIPVRCTPNNVHRAK